MLLDRAVVISFQYVGKDSIAISFFNLCLCIDLAFSSHAMALSASNAPTTWDRTLPIPPGLHSREMQELSRRNSTLLQHHISSDQLLAPASHDVRNRSIIAYSSLAPKCEQDKSLAEDERPTHRSASVMSSESMTTSSSDGLASQELSSGYCLCKPDPHVPRPRNGMSYEQRLL